MFYDYFLLLASLSYLDFLYENILLSEKKDFMERNKHLSNYLGKNFGFFGSPLLEYPLSESLS